MEFGHSHRTQDIFLPLFFAHHLNFIEASRQSFDLNFGSFIDSKISYFFLNIANDDT